MKKALIFVGVFLLLVLWTFPGAASAPNDKLVSLHGKAGLSVGDLKDSIMFQRTTLLKEVRII